MGKGGTKFVGDAIGARSGRSTRLSGKERAKNMATFLETGVHPELAEAARTRGPVVTVLPPLSPLRPFVFLQFNCGKKTVGKIIIELFDDIVPTAAKYFLSRCLSSSAAHPEDCLVGKQVTKVLHGVCFVCTISKSQDVGGARLTSKSEPSLRHCESGVVSVRCDGNDVCIALAATLPQYDATHQVIGRVIPICMSVVETIADVPTTADDVPAQAVIISRTGKTDAHGKAEIDVVDVDKKTPDDVGRVLKSENVQRSVLEAIAVGSKRTTQKIEHKYIGNKSSKKRALDRYAMGLDDESSSSSDGDSE